MSECPKATARSLPPKDRRIPEEPPSGEDGGGDGQGVPLAVSVLVIAVVLLIVGAMG